MEHLTSSIAGISYLLESFAYFYIIGGLRNFTKHFSYKILFIVSIFLFLVTTLIFDTINSPWQFIQEVEIIIIMRLFFEEKLTTIFRIWLWNYFIASIAGGLFYWSLMPIWINSNMSDIALDCIGSLLLLIIYYIILGRKLPTDVFEVHGSTYLYSTGIIVVFGLLYSFFSYILNTYFTEKIKITGMILMSIGSLAICIFIFLFLYNINITHKYKIREELSDDYIKGQKIYFETLLKKEEETRRFRHDISTDLTVIKTLNSQNKSEELTAYIDKVFMHIKAIKKIDYDVCDDRLNTLLSFHLSSLKDCPVTITGKLTPEISFVNREACLVFSNLLKNAVESQSHLDKSHRGIHIKFLPGSVYLRIVITNKYASQSKKSDLFTTNKLDKKNHGYGIDNATRYIKRLNGKIEYDVCEDNFTATAIFPISSLT